MKLLYVYYNLSKNHATFTYPPKFFKDVILSKLFPKKYSYLICEHTWELLEDVPSTFRISNTNRFYDDFKFILDSNSIGYNLYTCLNHLNVIVLPKSTIIKYLPEDIMSELTLKGIL